MLYKGADLIRDVEFVIFDEVHYVNDAEVGAEPLACYSNADEVARSGLGRSDHHASGACEHHLTLGNRAKHEGICGLGWVSC